MDHAMVERTDPDQVRESGSAAVAAFHDVMDVEAAVVMATG